MRKSVFFYLFSLMTFSTVAHANLPSLSTSQEVEHCIQHTNDWTSCLKTESTRELNKIKLKYRQLLADKTLMEWNKNVIENKQFFFDLYESWTAYRNRACSLYKLASQYTGPLVDSNQSCTISFMQKHRTELDYIIRLIERKVPKKQSQFDFMRFTHDEEYTSCNEYKKENKDNKVNCLKEEIERSMDAIQNRYQEALKNDMIGEWNNGPSLQQGNYRDMFDSWLAYRNRFCSLAIWAYKRYYGEKSVSMNYCLESFNKDKEELMTNIVLSSLSFLDDEMTDETTDGFDDAADVGKRITPLQRRFDNLKGFKTEELKDDEKPQEHEEVQETTEENDNTPAWAKASR